MPTNTNLRGFLWNDAGDALSAVTVEARVADADGVASTSVYATGAYSAGKWDITSLDDAYNYEVKLTSGAQVRRLNGAAKPIYYEVTLVDRLKAGDGTVALPSLTFRNDLNTGFYRYGADQIGAAVGGALSLLIGNKVAFIGDTANANMTQGLTLNQAGNDDEILALKSSDVAHGITDWTETDTFAYAKKASATGGGLNIVGLRDADDDAWGALVLEGFLSEAADTTKSTIGHGVVRLVASVKDGAAGLANVGADGNLLSVENNSTTRLIVDAEGTIHPIIGDADLDVIRLSGTTGTPALAWNETRDRFTLSKGLELTAGILFVGDTANTGMTTGITINQGAADNEILALKSSDVAHGITDWTETDTFAYAKKASATGGGLNIVGLRDADDDAWGALVLEGFLGEAADATKSTIGHGVVRLVASVKDGAAGLANVGADGNLLSVENNSTTRLIVDAEGTIHSIGASYTDSMGNGLWFINDATNAKMTVGLTINQGANDDQILSLKSSDVGHTMTAADEADDFGAVRKQSADFGGLEIRGLSESYQGLVLTGFATSDMTTKGTTGQGYVEVNAGKATGVGGAVGAAGADANLFVVRNYGTTRFILDAEGSAHADVEFVTFDAFDDIKLLDALTLEVQRRHDPIKQEFGNWLSEYRELLQRERIVNFYDNGPRAMINFTRLNMLMCGAIRQIARRVETMETKFQLGAGN